LLKIVVRSGLKRPSNSTISNQPPQRSLTSRFHRKSIGKTALLPVKPLSGNQPPVLAVQPFSCRYSRFPTEFSVSRKENSFTIENSHLPIEQPLFRPESHFPLRKMIFPKPDMSLKMLKLLELSRRWRPEAS
jgi:hypothetical protein